MRRSGPRDRQQAALIDWTDVRAPLGAQAETIDAAPGLLRRGGPGAPGLRPRFWLRSLGASLEPGGSLILDVCTLWLSKVLSPRVFKRFQEEAWREVKTQCTGCFSRRREGSGVWGRLRGAFLGQRAAWESSRGLGSADARRHLPASDGCAGEGPCFWEIASEVFGRKKVKIFGRL